MLGLIHDQVWMGSKDSIIYIIDTVSMSCNQQLTEHRQEVTCLAVDPQPQNGRLALFRVSHLLLWIAHARYNETTPPLPSNPTHTLHSTTSQQTYSCSSDGSILQWDSASLKVKRQFSLRCERLSSIQVHDGALWCCKYVSVDFT